MSPPIRDGSGNSINSIRLGDGSEISEVRTGAGDVLFSANSIPDSLENQYDFVNNLSAGDGSVNDPIGSDPMSLSGTFTDATIGGESGAEGDSTDNGTADAYDAAADDSFGLAFSFAGSKFSGDFAGADEAFNPGISVRGEGGNIELLLADDDNHRISAKTSSTFDGGSTYACVINKNGNTASDIKIYITDMTNPESVTTPDSSSKYQSDGVDTNWKFWARNNDGTADNHINVTMGVFEFNSDTYSQTDRQNFVSRRPEL